MLNNDEKILIVSDSFLPEKISAAKHMSDLVDQFCFEGYSCTIVSSVKKPIFLSKNIRMVTKKSLFKKSKMLRLRVISEMISPIYLLIKYLFFLKNEKYKFTIVYSPSIFWVFFYMLLNKNDVGKVKLILRDLFPKWLEQVNIIHKESITYRILNYVCKLQYKIADEIFVQSKKDKEILISEYDIKAKKIIILDNWYSTSRDNCELKNFKEILIQGKRNILLVGNYGYAQNRDFLVKVLVEVLKNNNDCNLIVVGMKNPDIQFFKHMMPNNHLEKLKIIKNLEHDECVKLAGMCDLGIVSLHPDNTPGNIPGKFCLYCMSGLPIFSISPENFEVSQRISKFNLGKVEASMEIEVCAKNLSDFNVKLLNKNYIKEYGIKTFSTQKATKVLTGK